MPGTKAVRLIDSNDKPFGVRQTSNALDVYIQDQTTPIIDLYLHRHIGNDITVSSNAAIDDYILNVTSGHGAVAGNFLCLKEGTRFYQGGVSSVAAELIYLDTPLDYAFTTSATCSPTTKEMNVEASVSSVYTYHVQPNAGVKWDITRILFFMEGPAQMDSTLFGSVDALTNGVVLRKKNDEYYNIFNAKTNGDLANRAYDVSYDDRASAQSKYAFRCRRTFGGQSKNGVVIRLDGDNDDEMELIIRDDVSSLSIFNVIVQGHIVE